MAIPFALRNASNHGAYLFFEHDPGIPVANPIDISYTPYQHGPLPEWAWWQFDIDDVTGGKGDFMKRITNAEDPDLTRFLLNNGGKLILYHGWLDVGAHPEPTLDYYESVVDTVFQGDMQKAHEHARLFMFPGMAHCRGGPGPDEWDPLAPLVAWVERGEAPDSVIAVNRTDGVVDNERPVCAHPAQAVYDGPPKEPTIRQTGSPRTSVARCRLRRVEEADSRHPAVEKSRRPNFRKMIRAPVKKNSQHGILVAAVVCGFVIVLGMPSRVVIPVRGASPTDWNPKSFWYEPWGKSGVHKGIDIFAQMGTPVIAGSSGIVVFRGEAELGGRVVAVLGPKWRLHYYAHLDSFQRTSLWISVGDQIGTVGDSGNAAGKQPHLHYAVISLLPYPWLYQDGSQGWKRMFYLDPVEQFGP